MKTLKRGFTLIELAVTLAIVAILFAQAAPSFTAWIHNAEIRTAAESMQSGLQLARAEAIRRNRSVFFWLTSATATPPVADWLVACASPAGGGAVPEAIGDCPGVHPSGGVPANAAPINWIQRQAAAGQQTALPQVSTPNNATEVTFGSLGLVIPNVDGTPSIAEIDVSDPSISTARPLHVTISGGQIRMCDPGLSPSTDPRGC
jgi:type IV fimbrial biogenesis protein FimT